MFNEIFLFSMRCAHFKNSQVYNLGDKKIRKKIVEIPQFQKKAFTKNKVRRELFVSKKLHSKLIFLGLIPALYL